MKTTSILVPALAAVFAFAPALRAAEEKGDAKFVSEAALGGLLEVRLGKLAEKKGQRADVKEFGAMMVKDHGKANDELKKVAEKNQIVCPTELDAKHQAKVDKLEALTGADFDKAYISSMVKDHEEDVAEFKKVSTSATNADVKQFATKTLPTLETHLTHIKEIQKAK